MMWVVLDYVTCYLVLSITLSINGPKLCSYINSCRSLYTYSLFLLIVVILIIWWRSRLMVSVPYFIDFSEMKVFSISVGQNCCSFCISLIGLVYEGTVLFWQQWWGSHRKKCSSNDDALINSYWWRIATNLILFWKGLVCLTQMSVMYRVDPFNMRIFGWFYEIVR